MRKEHKSKKGGLTKAGRAYISFAARFGGANDPVKDEKGELTKHGHALKRWGFGSVAAARKFAAKNKKSQEDKTMPMKKKPKKGGKKGGGY